MGRTRRTFTAEEKLKVVMAVLLYRNPDFADIIYNMTHTCHINNFIIKP